MMRVKITEKKKKKTAGEKQELLVDEAETKSECERKGGEFCYMIQKPQKPKTVEYKPSKPVKLKENIYGLGSDEVKFRNEIDLNNLLKTVEMKVYSRLQEIIEGFAEEEFSSFMTRLDAVEALVSMAQD